MQCNYGITHYYVIATEHVCAKSAELVHTEVKKLEGLCSVVSRVVGPIARST